MAKHRDIKADAIEHIQYNIQKYVDTGFNDEPFHAALRRALFERKLSQVKVAKDLNLSYQRLNAWVSGRALPSVVMVVLFAVYLKMPSEYLVCLMVRENLYGKK